MKTSTKILIIVALSIVTFASGCNEEFGSNDISSHHTKPHWDYFYAIDSEGQPGYWLEYTYISHSYIKPTGGNKTFSIVSSFAVGDVNIESTESWLTYEKAGDSNYILTAESNSSSVCSRTGYVIITPIDNIKQDSHDYKIIIEVDQDARHLSVYQDNNIVEDGTKLIIPQNGGISSSFEVRADGDYTIFKGENDSWYSINHNKTTNMFVIDITENPTNITRNGIITVALTGLPHEESQNIKIKIRQEPSPISDLKLVKTSELILDRSYLLVAEDYCAISMSGSYMESDMVNIKNGVIIQDTSKAFTFTNNNII